MVGKIAVRCFDPRGQPFTAGRWRRAAIGADLKLAVLVAIIVIVLINRKREVVANWVLPAIGTLTVANIAIATVWR